MTKARLLTPVLIGGCVILMLNFAVRASFGVFQIPIAAEFNWPRSEFSLAIAIQNLAWGIGQPIFGALAEQDVVTAVLHFSDVVVQGVEASFGERRGVAGVLDGEGLERIAQAGDREHRFTQHLAVDRRRGVGSW